MLKILKFKFLEKKKKKKKKKKKNVIKIVKNNIKK